MGNTVKNIILLIMGLALGTAFGLQGYRVCQSHELLVNSIWFVQCAWMLIMHLERIVLKKKWLVPLAYLHLGLYLAGLFHILSISDYNYYEPTRLTPVFECMFFCSIFMMPTLLLYVMVWNIMNLIRRNMAGGEKKRVSPIDSEMMRERGMRETLRSLNKRNPQLVSDVSRLQVGQQVDAEYVGEMSSGNESYYGGPGYFFRTMDEAAQDFAMKYNDDSIRDNVEIASYIRKKGSYYFYDVPHGGTIEGVTSYRSISEVDIVASIHTHAAYNSKIKELPGGVYTRTSLVPSLWDVKSVKETGLPLYTVTPDGTMFLTEKDIESEAGVIHYIFDADFPSDPNCHVRKNLLDANTMSDNDYISQDEYKRRKDQR